MLRPWPHGGGREPGLHFAGLRVAPADERLQRVVVGRFEYVIAPEQCGDLTEDDAQFPEVERDLLECEDGHAFAQPPRKPRRVEFQPRRGHARLHAVLEHDQFDLHVDGCRQFRLLDLQAAEGRKLGRVGAFGARA